MQFYKVREELMQGKSIFNISLRVTFYARVSTYSDEQLNSLENQISYFENYIKDNHNWVYVKGYVDEGISGSSVKNRANFLKMINDAKNGCFDLIITKEVSRFSRNLADSIKYTQELISSNVGVYFQTNGINTYDANSEFILNMMGSVAQEEVKRLSTRIKWGHRNAINRGRVLGSNSITGYIKDNGKLVILDDEAYKVKMIFSLYATGNYGFYKLAKELHKRGFNNYFGNIYDKDTLKRIIENPKYKGFYRGHTTEVIDYKTKKRVYIPKKDQVIFKDDNIPLIVDEDLWNRANFILAKRSNLIKESHGNAKKIESKYAYTAKILCKEHNTCYQRMTNKRKSNKPRWACSRYIRYRVSACESPIILEMDLDNIFKIIFKTIFKDKISIINDMKKIYANIQEDSSINIISKINKEIKLMNIKKDKLLELNIDKIISNLEFKERNEKYNDDIKSLMIKKEEIIQDDLLIKKGFNLDIIEDYINKILSFDDSIHLFIRFFLDKVIIDKINNDRHKLDLYIYLNLFKDSNLEKMELFHGEVHSMMPCKASYKMNIFKYYVYGG